jgi:5-methylcytosine-specific restriction endonuclease McrA
MYTYPFKSTDEQSKKLVWNKGRVIPDFDSEVWRWDKCGNVMKYSEHGNVNSENGWEIDHIKPTSLGGSNELSNLQPLQWENNRSKGDTYPWSCP